MAMPSGDLDNRPRPQFSTGGPGRPAAQILPLKGIMRKLFTLLAALPLLLGAGVLTATSAQAAPPACTSWTTYYDDYAGSNNRDWVTHQPTTGSQNGNRTCQLKQGNNNAAVKVLQRALNWCWGASLTVDGEFGPGTKAEVLDLQRSKNASFGAGLTVDGQFGPKTAEWLMMPMWSWPDNQPAWSGSARDDVICHWPDYGRKI
jgi:hypothetical protein